MRQLLALCLFSLALAAPLHAADKPHNIVFMVADDLGRQVGCYGDKIAKTPHLDALAKSGTRFENGFAAVASCSPSRSVMYTGMYTHANGQYGLAHATHNFNTKPNVKSLPGYLRAAGYQTCIIGKTHIIPASVYDWDVELKSNGRNGVQMANQVAKFLSERGDKPFCVVFGFTDPHRAQKGYANDVDYPGIKSEKFDPKSIPVPNFLPDRDETRIDLAEYYQSVHRLDQGVGAVMELLRKTGHDKNTLVVFLSDNGIPFPGAKTTVYDAGINLPLIVRKPGQKEGVVSKAMVSWVDVLPTMLDWANVKPSKAIQGRSFLSVLEEANPKGFDEVFASHTFHEVTMYYPMRAVRTRQHKYIRNLAHKLDFPFASDLYGSPTWQAVLKNDVKLMGKRATQAYVNRPAEELYDIVNDPDEVKNLADDKSHAKTLETLRQKLRDWQTKTGDPWVVKYTHE